MTTPAEDRLVTLIAEAARGPQREGLFALWLVVRVAEARAARVAGARVARVAEARVARVAAVRAVGAAAARAGADGTRRDALTRVRLGRALTRPPP